MLKRRWSIGYTLINLGKVACREMYKQKGESGLIESVLHFVYVDLYANGYITRLIQSIMVLSEYDYISVSWLLLHICHDFHFSFSWAVWWP